MTDRALLRSRIVDLIEHLSDGSQNPRLRDTLIDDLAAWQAEKITAYSRLFVEGNTAPAIPTDVFRFTRLSAHDKSLDTRSFTSSGTTQNHKSVHSFRELALYDLAARTRRQLCSFSRSKTHALDYACRA